MICCRDRADHLQACLPAVARVLRPQDELIVADSASTTADVALVAVDAGARVVRVGEPGASIARNAGWRATGKPIVAFTDDDCRPAAAWIERIEAAFSDPTVGFVYGAVAAARDSDDARPAAALSVTTATEPRRWAAGNVRAIGEFGHGANIAVRRSALTAVDGWAPRLGAGVALAGGEDADLALRLLRAGWDGCFAPDAVVDHTAWRNRASALRTVWGYGLGAGAVAVRSRRADGSWWLLRHEVGERGLAQVARDAQNRYEFGVASGVVRTGGVLVGALRTLAGAA